MYRHRFKNGILAEFLPPARHAQKARLARTSRTRTRGDKLIILCDGLPSIPRKQPLAEFLAKKGYWVLYPRYKGSWESHGELLETAPNEDIAQIIDELPNGLTDIAFGEHFTIAPNEIFVIGGSFGGAAALMCSLNPKVKKVIANCPVVDWSILEEELPKETSNKSYAAYLREAFGSGYRVSDKNWKKLETQTFFNPTHDIKNLDPRKIMMFHAKDDEYIPWQGVDHFAKKAKIRLHIFARGGHLDTTATIQKQWARIKKFFG
jgi:esterase/lipase